MNSRVSPWPWLALAAGYAGVAVLMLAPVTNFAEFSSAIAPGDAKLLAWTFAWTSHAILAGRPLFDANIFYPAQPSLAFAEHHIGVGIWGLPLYAVTGNPVLVFSVLKFAGLALNALAMHVLVWRWLRNHGAALVAGLIFGVSSTRLLGSGHLPIVWNCWLPLILLALERWAATRQWRWMLAAAVFVSLQALATWYLAVMAALAVVLFGVWRGVCALRWFPAAGNPDESSWTTMRRRRARWRALAQVGVGALLVAASVWPFAHPYLALAGHAEVAPGIAGLYAADARSYIQPPDHALLGPLIARITGLGAQKDPYERVQFLGLLTIALAAAGAARFAWLLVRRRGDRRSAGDVLWAGYFLLLGSVALALSFGPSSGDGIRTPFDLIAKAPVLGMFRVPSRFSVLVTLAVAGLAALGFVQVQRLGRRAAVVACFVLVPIMLLEWAVVPPASARPAPDRTPPIYRLVAALPVHALVSLPCYRRTGPTWPLDADYMLYSTVHWKPIVNGYGRTEPPGLHWVVGAVDAFPGPNSAIRMRALGIDYVVLHAARYADGAVGILAEARASEDFQLVARIGDDYLFRVLLSR